MNKIIIDNRENAIFPYLSSLPYTKENLILGDYLISYKDGKNLCIERKTWKDLWSSILDGRFREQRSRLLEWKNNDNFVIYLIEGQLEENQDTCRKTVHRLVLVYHFAVWFSENIEDSAKYLKWLCDQNTLFKESSPLQDQISKLSSSIVKKKKDVQTPHHYLIAFLQSISGISFDIATQIIHDGNHDLKSFISFYSQTEGLALLAEKTYKTKTDKNRKLGKEKAKRILEMIGILNSTNDNDKSLHKNETMENLEI